MLKIIFTFIFCLALSISYQNNLEAASSDIATFRNKNPQFSNGGNATQSNSTFRPSLVEKSENKLPTLEFDGDDEYLTYDGSNIVGKDYTIFVIEKRTNSKANNYFFGSTNASPSANEGLILGYKTENELLFGQGNNEELIPIGSYNSDSQLMLHTFVHDSLNGKKYYRNGAEVYSNSSNTAPLISNSNTAIGRNGTNHYDGKIGEIAIFTRSLNIDEISEISSYMIDKWKIEEVIEGTQCSASSPGYVGGDVLWNESLPIDSDQSLTFSSCDNGKTLSGTMGPLNCKNGVLSGDTSGSCVILQCDQNSPGYIADSTLGNGSWSNGGVANYGSSVNLTCDSGSQITDHNSPDAGPIASITMNCNSGTWSSAITATEKCRQIYIDNNDWGISFPIPLAGEGWYYIVDDRCYHGTPSRCSDYYRIGDSKKWWDWQGGSNGGGAVYNSPHLSHSLY